MGLTVTSPPDGPIVQLGVAKAHLRLESTDEDALVSQLVEIANAHFDGPDGILGRALLTQSWQWTTPIPENGRLVVPLAPLQSIDAFSVDGTTLDPADYGITDANHGILTVAAAWRCRDAVIDFTAGYGNANAVPLTIGQAMLLLVGHWYESREEFAPFEHAPRSIPYGVRALTAPYRRMFT
jgi:uncharacterized phiE125 gp8 family phage protein